MAEGLVLRVRGGLAWFYILAGGFGFWRSSWLSLVLDLSRRVRFFEFRVA